jgi:hypothetical protein
MCRGPFCTGCCHREPLKGYPAGTVPVVIVNALGDSDIPIVMRPYTAFSQPLFVQVTNPSPISTSIVSSTQAPVYTQVANTTPILTSATIANTAQNPVPVVGTAADGSLAVNSGPPETGYLRVSALGIVTVKGENDDHSVSVSPAQQPLVVVGSNSDGSLSVAGNHNVALAQGGTRFGDFGKTNVDDFAAVLNTGPLWKGHTGSAATGYYDMSSVWTNTSASYPTRQYCYTAPAGASQSAGTSTGSAPAQDNEPSSPTPLAIPDFEIVNGPCDDLVRLSLEAKAAKVGDECKNPV